MTNEEILEQKIVFANILRYEVGQLDRSYSVVITRRRTNDDWFVVVYHRYRNDADLHVHPDNVLQKSPYCALQLHKALELANELVENPSSLELPNLPDDVRNNVELRY